MFIRNHWYVALWSKELTRELSWRTIMNERIALYRTESGSPVALQDSCPHRNLPLSKGKLIGDIVQCGYHGLEFNSSGACTKAPGLECPPTWAKVRSYPVVERNNWIYVWMGDAQLADESLIPSVFGNMSDPDWHCVIGDIHVKGGYRLIVDNLLDLSHLAYVHGTTTGNPEVAELADLQTDATDESVRITRMMRDVVPAPAYKYYGNYSENVDRWQVTNYYAPSYILINNGSYAVSDRPATPVDAATERCHWGFQVYHAITPVTENQTIDHWCVALEQHMLKPEDRELWESQMINVLREDHEVYEAQQEWIEMRPENNNDVLTRGALPGDRALIAARQIQRRLHNLEARSAGGKAENAALATSR
ncbi:aromatic ring-hydroxylating dioxygenase subunit alpha [Pusillimonas caeni]|uniref:aromatic ring-hydroxylating dioxygenase subunit alpha n=1 Tax=Pusillimonas caeni TaxID=1348472 RepID=UPI000E59AB99|nr:aromatic ring-hydroxylating dioxygenase subunit alpha [Pusillimonas caeni]TFL14387.1 aromatic ring-hydroxylating dioxygenase subunit alpha [Pusillimonas caeni]